jgi:hypothetical protein
MSGEGEMGLEAEKFSGQVTLVRADQLDHGNFAVVVADPPRHTVEESEGTGMALLESLGAFPRKKTAETGIAVRQRQHEEGRVVAYARDDDLSAAEIQLALTRWVKQGHEDLSLRLLVGTHGIAVDACTTELAVFVA